MDKIVILFTNAPEGYDYPFIVKTGEIDGCRILDCPPKLVGQQTDRNSSGLYWTTSDIEEASLLRRDFPYKTTTVVKCDRHREGPPEIWRSRSKRSDWQSVG